MSLTDALGAATRVQGVPKLRQSMQRFWKEHSAEPGAVAEAAAGVWRANPGDDGETSRMGAAIILGPAAVTVPDATEFLLDTVADDPGWRVQEALAKALDWRCEVQGWNASLPTLEQWLGHPVANVRRAAAEGPRVWTRRPHFKDHPGEALRLLGLVRGDDSDYVRKSVGNAISDISKSEPDLVLETLERWKAEGGTAPAVLRGACRKLRDTHPDRTKGLLDGS
ncbi:hypothetical protein GCM10022254_36280 [Actinomadura meridiana]|uniref:DNA alkylation repair protein n=1 Tax=Actinomadura meridiana TaxID=559626 RepID=A0ABP8C4J7_9ACTN